MKEGRIEDVFVTSIFGFLIGKSIGYTDQERNRNACIGALAGFAMTSNFENETENDLSVVYELVSRKGRVMYIGIAYADRIEKRISEHLRIGKVFSYYDYTETMPRWKALNAEKKLIRKYRPKYNIQHNCY